MKTKKLKVSSRKSRRNKIEVKSRTGKIDMVELMLNSPGKLGRHNTTTFSSVQGSKTDYNRNTQKKLVDNARKGNYDY